MALPWRLSAHVFFFLIFVLCDAQNTTIQITTEGNNSTAVITSESTLPNTESTPTSPVTSDTVTTPTDSTEKVNSSTVEPNSTGTTRTSIMTSQTTTEDFSTLPANQTSTPKTTRSPPASTPKPGFDGASFGGGIALGVGIVLFFILGRMVFIKLKTRVTGPNYEVL
ncbi:uncharacterized protein LOC133180639 [Saccostrea echinata]|uniref:uncharacterized protein LOC133180639 n=1 Tax=Saccostrea echinata TaxID=191078 RepID=UPI002A7F3FAD|nr:uncharacterized protein LOC133180639 [Saccostrea echinata]